jgi:hypothetical protein
MSSFGRGPAAAFGAESPADAVLSAEAPQPPTAWHSLLERSPARMAASIALADLIHTFHELGNPTLEQAQSLATQLDAPLSRCDAEPLYFDAPDSATGSPLLLTLLTEFGAPSFNGTEVRFLQFHHYEPVLSCVQRYGFDPKKVLKGASNPDCSPS